VIRATIYHCLSGISSYWERTTFTIISDQYRIIQAYHKATTISLEEWTHYWQRLQVDIMVLTAWITDQLLHWIYEPHPLYVTVPILDATVRTAETYEQTHQRAEEPYGTRPTHKTPHNANLRPPLSAPKSGNRSFAQGRSI
jgi:hypothetical protein